jgi:(1->4)-alpha-D-glucan 1-alpha-D-glucosylmutase
MERLRRTADPSDTDREIYQCAAQQAQLILENANETGELRRAIDRVQDDKLLFDAVMQRQFYLLHDWRLSGELTNYRRFFDIDALIGIRAELPSVIAATHTRIERMVLNGEIGGVRVDHPDGLRDPLAYFRRLRELLPEGRIYIEKILENDERLNEEWPIDGTVGYDFLSKVNRWTINELTP